MLGLEARLAVLLNLAGLGQPEGEVPSATVDLVQLYSGSWAKVQFGSFRMNVIVGPGFIGLVFQYRLGPRASS